MRRRQAFTLLELMVMGGLGLVLMGIAWFIFTSMSKQSKKLDTRLRAIQASQLVIERLKQDLKQYVPEDDPSMTDNVPPRLSFHVYREYVVNPNVNDRTTPSMAVDLVNWTFSPETHFLSRNNEVLRFAQFESVQFSSKLTPRNVADFQNSVTVEGYYVPEEMLGTRVATDKDRVHWKATLGLPAATRTEAFGFCPLNPLDNPHF